MKSNTHRDRLVWPGLAAALLVLPAGLQPAVRADVKLPAIFGTHMVLQRDQKDRVWGWAEPGEAVTVQIGGQTKTVQAGPGGSWQVVLDPMPAGGPHAMTIRGKNAIHLDDVLVGEVWICSGQSNMQWSVSSAKDAELEIKSAKFPRIRLISVPQVGTQEPQKDFRGRWTPCGPETVGEFSAVGYFFGRQLYQILEVPIGLIDDAWGGSACEAWIRRDLLAADAKYAPLLQHWEQLEKDLPRAKAEYQLKRAERRDAVAKAKAQGKRTPQQPQDPEGLMRGNSRPGNIYNGVLKPTIGYGIRGVIWYQGETNAGRAYQYRDLFPLMIQSWRDEWGQGEFPFYWVQLADYRAESLEPKDSDWAELREAQTMAMSRLPSTGQAVIIDIGEGKDIHPKDKQDVAMRLARWALARDYGIPVAYQSPTYKAMAPQGNKVVLTFDHVGRGLITFDVNEPHGFAIAGSDRKFVWAKAQITGPNTVEVWSDQVAEPVAVRYAWADNPVCNLYSAEGLPATPFRTDDWPGVTIHHDR
jgi:sialate O-acetylesterase